MSTAEALQVSPGMEAAIVELQELVRQRYPEATFEISRSPENPETVLLKPDVDVEDRDEVMDLVIDRLGELQSEDHLPIFVVPIRPPARRQAIGRALREAGQSWRTGHPALQP